MSATPFSLHYPPYWAGLSPLAGCASLLAPPAATASWTQLGLQATTAAPRPLHAPEDSPGRRLRNNHSSSGYTLTKLMHNQSIVDVTLVSVRLGSVKLMFRNDCLASFFTVTYTANTNSQRYPAPSNKLYKSGLGKKPPKTGNSNFFHASLR